MLKKVTIIIIILLIIYILVPNIKFKYKNYYIEIGSKPVDYFDSDVLCYDESYYVDTKNNISIYEQNLYNYSIINFRISKFIEGNICEKEFVLEEYYINHFIKDADIQENEDKIDIAKLIEGKKAIVGNARYSNPNDDSHMITYILDEKYQEMYVFNKDDLLIIQVGNSDEGPKYIAYK